MGSEASEKPMRVWALCPMCRRAGRMGLIKRIFPEATGVVYPNGFDNPRPCPTCAAHFAAVGAAYDRGVREERERRAGLPVAMPPEHGIGYRDGVADALAAYRAALRLAWDAEVRAHRAEDV